MAMFGSDFSYLKKKKNGAIWLSVWLEGDIKKTLTLMSGFSIIPPNCTDFQKSVSQRVLKISTWEKVR